MAVFWLRICAFPKTRACFSYDRARISARSRSFSHISRAHLRTFAQFFRAIAHFSAHPSKFLRRAEPNFGARGAEFRRDRGRITARAQFPAHSIAFFAHIFRTFAQFFRSLANFLRAIAKISKTGGAEFWRGRGRILARPVPNYRTPAQFFAHSHAFFAHSQTFYANSHSFCAHSRSFVAHSRKLLGREGPNFGAPGAELRRDRPVPNFRAIAQFVAHSHAFFAHSRSFFAHSRKFISRPGHNFGAAWAKFPHDRGRVFARPRGFAHIRTVFRTFAQFSRTFARIAKTRGGEFWRDRDQIPARPGPNYRALAQFSADSRDFFAHSRAFFANSHIFPAHSPEFLRRAEPNLGAAGAEFRQSRNSPHVRAGFSHIRAVFSRNRANF